MAFSKLKDFEASSRRPFKEYDLTHFEAYNTQGEKAGQVVDVLVDEAGHLQYLVVDLSDGMAGNQVLLPEGDFQVDKTTRRIYLSKLKLAPAKDLVAYNPDDKHD